MMKPDPSARRRSLLKALSWESISNIVVFFLAYLMFGNIELCTIFFVISFLLKIGMFYIHERIWHQVPYGKRH